MKAGAAPLLTESLASSSASRLPISLLEHRLF